MTTNPIRYSLHAVARFVGRFTGRFTGSFTGSFTGRFVESICAVPSDPQCLPIRDLIDLGRVDAAYAMLFQLRAHPASRAAESERLALSARLHLFASRADAAERDAAESMLRCKPGSLLYRNAFYLRANALYAAGRFAEMRSDIANMRFLDHSNRFYRMVRLSIDDKAHRAFFMETYARVAHRRHLLRWPDRLQERGRDLAYGQYVMLLRNLCHEEEAMRFAKFRLAHSLANGCRPGHDSTVARRPGVWRRLSGVALSNLKTALDQAHIRYFLIGGTLLGHVREGKLLDHDRDIDIGVDVGRDLNQTRAQIASALQASGVFRLRPILATHCMYAEHINGTFIDIFQHFMEEGAYCHQGLKSRWANTPFDLKEITLCGKRHCIPVHPDRYLSENYGDWRTPKRVFETFLDTPNMRITRPVYFALHCLTSMNDSYRRGDLHHFQRLSERYASLCQETPQLATFRL